MNSGDVTSMMGDNDWVFVLKLETSSGENEKLPNCTTSGNKHSCYALVATSTEPSLKLETKYKVDEENSSNPVYQFIQTCLKNNFVSWNDQGSKNSCDGGSGGAHNKGALAYNSNLSEGVYMQSSCPNWGDVLIIMILLNHARVETLLVFRQV